MSPSSSASNTTPSSSGEPAKATSSVTPSETTRSSSYATWFAARSKTMRLPRLLHSREYQTPRQRKNPKAVEPQLNRASGDYFGSALNQELTDHYAGVRMIFNNKRWSRY